MARQMERHLRCNNLLTMFQSGFRRHHSTTVAVLKVTEDIRLSMEDGQVTVLLLLDFSQPFDRVVHGLLLCKLRNAQNYSVGAGGMLVGSYLGERAQFVRSGGQASSVEAPQGSVGPLLFLSYIDNVSRIIRYCRFHIYADDMQIYHTCAVLHFQRCIDELNLDLQRVHKKVAANCLQLNSIKSQVIVISRCRVDIPPPTLLIGSDVINVVPKVNNLGFVMNQRLTATAHFKKVCQKVYWILRYLRPYASHTPFEVRMRLLVSLIMPHIGCEGIVYAGADAATQRRYIHSLRWLDHVSHLETSVMGALLADYSRIKLLSFLYKVLHVRHPCLRHLFSLFRFASSARTRN
jgi:hypothetical protein